MLNVLGMYPGDPGAPGGDCAGIVLASWPVIDSPALPVGTAVFGLAAGSLGSHVRASAQTVVPMPANLGFEEAATMPTVFVTVDVALHRCAAAQPGERVLVHAAAGGVGLAAVQLIQAMGAVPLATAGSPAKRSLLHSLGVGHVLGSRDTTFAAEAAQLGGAGVVLNSLTSAGMVAGSLAALSPSGRFVEISKRDIWSAARVAQGEGRRTAAAAHVAFLHASVPRPLAAFQSANNSVLPTSSARLQSAPTCATPWWRWTSCPSALCTLHCLGWHTSQPAGPSFRCR